ncbi:hypothetical protein [Streptomyces sp. NPDC002758]
MKRIGCTGHQALSAATRSHVAKAIVEVMASLEGETVLGLTCLAEGADQIFAFAVLAAGGQLHVVLPSEDYENSFDNDQARTAYEALLRLASSTTQLEFASPGEDAYLAAGQEVADSSDILLAVWDGKPAAGKGGTADVVSYAQHRGTDVRVIWPPGAARR